MAIEQPDRRAWIGFVLVAVLGWSLCLAPAVQAQPKPTDAKEPEKTAEIKKLLKERRDLLQDVVKQLMAQYEVGVSGLERVVQAQRDLLKADIDLADDPKERLSALKENLKLAEKFAQVTEGRFKAGAVGTTKVDVLQAKSIVLEVRIEMLREELKAKPPK